jgi:transposase-like protein
MEHVPPGLLTLVALLLALAVGIWCWGARVRRTGAPGAARHRRIWRPRTPDDCPACRATGDDPACPPSPVEPPWSEVKGRRGAPKRVVTAGYACPSARCPYSGITDSRVHALVGYGHRGTTDRIQGFRCQACGTKVSARRGTALYQLKTSPARVGEVLSALAEGLDVAAAVRVFGHGEGTIAHWQARAARQADRVHDRLLRDLHLPHIQLDELRTRLRAPRRPLAVGRPRSRDEDRPRGPPRAAHPGPGARPGPRPDRPAPAGLRAGRHERRAAALLLRAHRPFRPVAGGESAPRLARRRGPALRAGQEGLPVPSPRARAPVRRRGDTRTVGGGAARWASAGGSTRRSSSART